MNIDLEADVAHAAGKLGAPEDIGGPVAFIASDEAVYITGASLLVDGRLFVNLQ